MSQGLARCKKGDNVNCRLKMKLQVLQFLYPVRSLTVQLIVFISKIIVTSTDTCGVISKMLQIQVSIMNCFFVLIRRILIFLNFLI